jgi:hypothetical protein
VRREGVTIAHFSVVWTAGDRAQTTFTLHDTERSHPSRYDMRQMSQGRRSSFVVRVVEGRRGQVAGVVERAATGAKEAFGDLEAIGQVIRHMLRDARPFTAAGPRHAPSPAKSPGRPTRPPAGDLRGRTRRR